MYDALVDSGVSGVAAFSSILFQLAHVSGLLRDTQAEKLSEMCIRDRFRAREP